MGDHEASLTQWEQHASGCVVGFCPWPLTLAGGVAAGATSAGWVAVVVGGLLAVAVTTGVMIWMVRDLPHRALEQRWLLYRQRERDLQAGGPETLPQRAG